MLNPYKAEIATNASGPCERCLKYVQAYLVIYTIEYDKKFDIHTKIPHILCHDCIEDIHNQMREAHAKKGSSCPF